MDKDRRLFLEGTINVTQAGILLPAGEGLRPMIERFAYEPFLEQCRASLITCKVGTLSRLEMLLIVASAPESFLLSSDPSLQEMTLWEL